MTSWQTTSSGLAVPESSRVTFDDARADYLANMPRHWFTASGDFDYGQHDRDRDQDQGELFDLRVEGDRKRVAEMLRDYTPEAEGPQAVRASPPREHPAPDRRREFGMIPLPSLLPSDEQTIELFEAVRDRRAAMVSTDPASSFAAITTTQSGRDTRLVGVTRRPGPRRIAELAGIGVEEVSWGSSAAFPIMGAGTAPSGTAEGEPMRAVAGPPRRAAGTAEPVNPRQCVCAAMGAG